MVDTIESGEAHGPLPTLLGIETPPAYSSQTFSTGTTGFDGLYSTEEQVVPPLLVVLLLDTINEPLKVFFTFLDLSYFIKVFVEDMVQTDDGWVRGCRHYSEKNRSKRKICLPREQHFFYVFLTKTYLVGGVSVEN